MDTKLPEVNACELCNSPKRNHGMTSAGRTKLHYWAEPSDALRVQRIKAIRAARTK